MSYVEEQQQPFGVIGSNKQVKEYQMKSQYIEQYPKTEICKDLHNPNVQVGMMALVWY